jgi:hypothetical protein
MHQLNTCTPWLGASEGSGDTVKVLPYNIDLKNATAGTCSVCNDATKVFTGSIMYSGLSCGDNIEVYYRPV